MRNYDKSPPHLIRCRYFTLRIRHRSRATVKLLERETLEFIPPVASKFAGVKSGSLLHTIQEKMYKTRMTDLDDLVHLIRIKWHSTGSTLPDCNWTTKFCSQRTSPGSHMEPSGTSTTDYGHRTCRRAPSSGHWRRTCSRPPDAIETSS